MNDRILSFQMMLLANKKEIGIKYKTTKEAKVALPEIVKELQDYVNSKDYLMLMVKEMQKLNSEQTVKESDTSKADSSNKV